MKKLRNSVDKVDRELSEISMAERLRSFNESLITEPKLPHVTDAATQVEKPHVAVLLKQLLSLTP